MGVQEQQLLLEWVQQRGLKSKEAAKVLAVSPSKMSEYLNGKRKIPRYILAHLDTLNCLSEKRLKQLIKNRLE